MNRKMLARPFLAAILAALPVTAAVAAPAAPAKLDVHPVFAQADSNYDGCITQREWTHAGLPKSAHDMLQDKRGCVTEAGMARRSPPAGIDTNRDGKLTVAEMLAYSRNLPKH